ncbi:CTP synthase [Sesamum alatum]|uniref:CTP synthase n=1 Tax=Sesamum alatum TaxID=300844 RepID=A0AAE2D0Y7_9LAMI|nr:CTP synthase [Sesamum alatum]
MAIGRTRVGRVKTRYEGKATAVEVDESAPIAFLNASATATETDTFALPASSLPENICRQIFFQKSKHLTQNLGRITRQKECIRYTMKYVLITGGVVSGLGKGVTASRIGVLLKACGLRDTSIKIDPYLNMDAGTMSPFEHGEVFVLDDGGEVSHPSLYLLPGDAATTGTERRLTGKDRTGRPKLKVVPHITDAIRNSIASVSRIPVDGKEGPADVFVVELGGTVAPVGEHKTEIITILPCIC